MLSRDYEAATTDSRGTVSARAGFKGVANWAVAQGPSQLRGLHKNSKKLLPKET